MAEFQKKKTAVVMKDSNGSLFQAMPETAAEHVSYGNSSLSDELDRQNNVDVAEITQEIETETETVVEEVTEQAEGMIRTSNDETGGYYNICFRVYLMDSINDYEMYIPDENYNSWIGYFYDEDGREIRNVNDYNSFSSEYGGVLYLPANKRYYHKFTMDSHLNPDLIDICLYGCTFLKNNEIDASCPGNIFRTLGTNYLQNSSYEGNPSSGENYIRYRNPAIGDSTTIYLNAWTYRDGNSNLNGLIFHEMTELDKSITIERLTDTEYVFSFYWDTTYASTVEKQVPSKKLKTTLTRVDETASSSSTQLSGFLQNVDVNVSQRIATESAPIRSIYYPYVYLGGGPI